MVKDLQSRIKQLINLEIELEDSRANYITLEKSLSENSRISIHKNDILQRNLEQLTLMYHQLVNKKAGLEVEKKIFEKKIQRLSDKTKFLEESNKDLNNQLVESKDQLKKLQENYQTPTSFLRGTMGTLTTLMPEARIKKPIRGGSQAKLLATFAVQARTYSSASNN